MKNGNFRTGLLLFLAALPACSERKPTEVSAAGVCGMRLRQMIHVRLVEREPHPVFRVEGIPAALMLDNLESPEAKTCVFELTGSEVRPGWLFFRYGTADRNRVGIEKISPERTRITYPISDRSYGLVSIEPPLSAPRDPHRFRLAGLACTIEGGALLHIEETIPRIRSLGPSTVIHMHNTTAAKRPVELIVDNTSQRLSGWQMRGEGGPGRVSISREKPLILRLKGSLVPGEHVWLMLVPRQLRYPYSFVFGGDVKQNLATFLQLLDRVQLKTDPLFMLAVGDYTRNSLPAELDAFFQATSRLVFPVYFVKGNHEARCQGDVHFQRLFGPERFTFVVDDKLFVSLDDSHRTEEGFYLGKDQLAWADKVLGEHRETRWKFIALHAPPHPLHGDTLHPTYSSNLLAADARALRKLAAKHNVAYVLSGHAHLYARREDQGVVYLTSGGGGAKLYSYQPVEGFVIDTRSHLMLFHVTQDGIEEEMVTLK